METCCSPDRCCTSKVSTGIPKSVSIDFLYLDLSQCSWCQGTEANLDSAIAKVSDVLKATGVELSVNKIHVATEEQAKAVGFTTSPTIKVNGKDIQLDYQEIKCTACSDLCEDDVECRVWNYRGAEYTAPPEGMIIEAILREVYGGGSEDCQTGSLYKPEVPRNLRKFFHGVSKKKQR